MTLQLFSGKKFYVPPTLSKCTELRSLISSHGGEVVDESIQEGIDSRTFFVVESFDGANVCSLCYCGDGLQGKSTLSR